MSLMKMTKKMTQNLELRLGHLQIDRSLNAVLMLKTRRLRMRMRRKWMMKRIAEE